MRIQVLHRLARSLRICTCRTPAAFRAVAILSVRHDGVYLDRCLREIHRQGLEAVIIDNDADAETRRIVDRYKDRCVRRVEPFPHPGFFDWEGILKLKSRIAREVDADWVTLWDSDEIREPPPGFRTLRDAFYFADKHGYNAADFDEFVFLPTRRDESYVGRDYVAEMAQYYWFRPRPHHRLNAWKNFGQDIDLLESAGHYVRFEGMKIFPEPFALRHYLFLGWNHALSKYCSITFSPAELAKGWCRERAALEPDNLRLPDPEDMSLYQKGRPWDRTRPRRDHPSFAQSG